MKYKICDNKIIIADESQFCPQHIFECGQVFSYIKHNEDHYTVLSKDKIATLYKQDDCWVIESHSPEYFENYFDLTRDYTKIKNQLQDSSFLTNAIDYGYGIRILKQDLLETLVSFVISANNNIKRIQKSLFYIREKLGERLGEYYAFPTLEKLKSVSVDFFVGAGTGYRASQLVKLFNQLDENILAEKAYLSTQDLRNWLISLSGVGGKVADCILLFGYARTDVFPVDTWIEQMYNEFFEKENNRVKIRDNLVAKYGGMSGFAQQYLFYYKREKNKK